MQQRIDLRSDTVTMPTEEMRKAMYEAEVGDDIMGEDKTVRELEEVSAGLLGKEAALFVTSGTMGNQIAVMAWAQRGEEIIVGDHAHIYIMESGALAALSQVQTRTLNSPDGIYDLKEMETAIQEKGVQNPRTALICVEDTFYLNAGLVVPQENLEAVKKLGEQYAVPVHMDGARIFNASVRSGVPLDKIAGTADSVMFALTKGLAAPFGGILAGSREFIEEARYLKQRIGGGLRQGGFMAAPGIVALQTMIPRIAEDHHHAQLLAEGLNNMNVFGVDPKRIHTNIVTGTVEDLGITIEDFLTRLHERGILAKRISKTEFRMVTHYGIEEEHIHRVISAVDEILAALDIQKRRS